MPILIAEQPVAGRTRLATSLLYVSDFDTGSVSQSIFLIKINNEIANRLNLLGSISYTAIRTY